jgi:hypothetical protein
MSKKQVARILEETALNLQLLPHFKGGASEAPTGEQKARVENKRVGMPRAAIEWQSLK